MEQRKFENVVESLLFASGDKLKAKDICRICGIDDDTVKKYMNEFIKEYNFRKSGIKIRKIGNGYQMCTDKENEEYVKMLYETNQKNYLSNAALEALAVIAYNKHCTRARVEKIRGVNSDSTINTLVEKGLVKEAGRLDAPGKPLIYEITDEFLRVFGIESLEDLPLLELSDR